MAAKKTTDTREHNVGQDQSKTLPASGSIDKGAIEDIIVQQDTPRFDEKMQNLKFAEERVEVTIIDSGMPDAEQLIHLSNNGVSQYLMRGIPTMVKRKFVEVLARAKLGNVSTNKSIDNQGNNTMNIKVTHGLKYPFTVAGDSRDGSDWLRRTLAEA